MSRKRGEVDGKHYTEYVETVRDLERSNRFAEAEALLWRLVQAVEEEARADGHSPAPWYYERLAIDFRKQKKYQAEVDVLKRYVAQVPTDDNTFTERLDKARQLLAKHQGVPMVPPTAQTVVAATAEPVAPADFQPPAVQAPLGLAAFVDVETTGLSRTADEVVELAVVLFWFRWDNGQVVQIADRYVGLREPSIPIPSAASRVHGLYMKDVRGKALDRGRILNMLTAANLVIAHNASFDYAFVTRLFPEAGRKPWFCSMNGISWRAKGFESKALQALLSGHRIHPGNAHRAGSDVDAAIQLLSTTNRAGIAYLKELLTSRTLNGVPLGQAEKAHTEQTAYWHGPSDTPTPPAAKRAGCSVLALVLLISLTLLLTLVV